MKIQAFTMYPFSILVIDDEPEIGQLLDAYLSAKGYQIEIATSITDARTLCAHKTFHCVLLDIQLPDGLGYDFVPELLGQHPDLPIICMSAYDKGIERARCMSYGAKVFMSKPFSLSQMLNAIKSCLTSSLENNGSTLGIVLESGLIHNPDAGPEDRL
jgi:two-component system, OmpR family, response regulator